MGNGNGKINTSIPVDTIVKRIDDCLLPDEKEVVLDFLEIMEAKIEIRSQLIINCKELQACKGIPILVGVLKQMLKDDTATRMGVAIFEHMKGVQFIIMDFIVHGGLEWLNKVKEEYAQDEFLSMAVPKLLKAILEIGASAAIEEIHRETTNLQLCHSCQETIERSRRLKFNSAVIHIPHSSERINRVTMFMENYKDKVNVLMPGLDSIIAYVNNADCKSSIQDTKVIEICSAICVLYPKTASIIWRVFVIFSITALISDDVACEIIDDNNMHEFAAEAYISFKGDFRTRQQLLWFFNSALRFPRARYNIQTSKVTMLFLKRLVEDTSHPSGAELAAKTNPFELIVPLYIRSFIRETKGEILNKVKNTRVVAEGRKRRIVAKKPVFGTVQTEIFKAGEPGLLPDEMESTANVDVGEEAPWEEHLQYGQKKAGKKIAPEKQKSGKVSKKGK